MRTQLQRTTVYVRGAPLELWSTPAADFSCLPADLRRYVEAGRWDLVFNALCYLTGAIEEGLA